VFKQSGKEIPNAIRSGCLRRVHKPGVHCTGACGPVGLGLLSGVGMSHFRNTNQA
jgi:hypothetical protein